MDLETGFCEHYCVQMTFFNSGNNLKLLMRRRTSILDGVCVNYEHLFQPLQCTACKICQCSSQDTFVLPEVISDQPFYFEV